MDLKNTISQAVADAVKNLYDLDMQVNLTVPEPEHGDFAANIAMQLAAKLGRPPREIAAEIAVSLSDAGTQAEVAGPGFINISVSTDALWRAAQIRECSVFLGKNYVVEYSCPNYFKEMHAGHLYQSLVGDALARMIERSGATVHRTNFGADVGLSTARAVWGIINDIGGEYPEKLADIAPENRARYIAERYVDGASADTTVDDLQSTLQIAAINKRIYEMHASGDTESDFAKIYFECRQWSKDYFLNLYEMVRIEPFEKYYPESTTEKLGMTTVNEFLGKGVFRESNGAIIFPGDEYGLHTRVFINSAGLPTYETKDIGLLIMEDRDFSFDHRLLITGSDQSEYMKVVWKAMEQIVPGSEAKMTHLCNGIIKFGDGKKMSSRLGNVTAAVDVVRMVREMVDKSDDPERDERIALGALKYELLKYKLGGDIAFDAKTSVSLHGNSGPYLQYAAVRASSMIAKSNLADTQLAPVVGFMPSEKQLIRKLAQYQNILESATIAYETHSLCAYLYELAGEFNVFYENNRVIGDSRECERLQIVACYAGTLKHGLALLGIQIPDKM
jgi:arginyl-tRNA synthetase